MRDARHTDSRCRRCGETTAYRRRCWLCSSWDMEHRHHSEQTGTLWCQGTPYRDGKVREYVKATYRPLLPKPIPRHATLR